MPVSRRRAVAALVASLTIVGPVAAQDQPPDTPNTPPPTRAPENLKPRGPLPPKGFLPYCLGLMQRGRYAEARKLLTPVVADHPGWAKAHFYLALTYHKQQQYEQAAELFRRAIELDPKLGGIRYHYGWCLYYRGRPAEARDMLNAFLETKPDYPDAVFALGLIDFDDDDIASAEARFRKVINLANAAHDAPMESKARARLADVLIRSSKLDAARRELDESLRLNPDNYEVYFKLARVLQRLGETDAAKHALDMHHKVRERIRPTQPRATRRPGE